MEVSARMNAFRAMFVASIQMLMRNRLLLITSLGISLISILVFGALFGSNTTQRLTLGVVNDDGSATSTQLISQLEQNASLTIDQGSQSAEVQALQDGNRDAVIVLPAGFGAALAQGQAHVQVYYGVGNPVTTALARSVVQNIATGLDQQITHQVAPIALDEQTVSVHTIREIDWLTPGQLGMMLVWANLSVGAVLVTWRKQGIMRRLAVTPILPSTLIGAQIGARLLISLAQAVLLIAVAMWAFQVQMYGSWLALGLTVLLGALTMLALGFAIGGFARTPDAAQAVMLLISFPMMFLGGAYFPTDSAPAFLKPLVQAMPLTYLNDALRQIMNNGASLTSVHTDLLVLGAWMVVALILSVRAFRWS
jgi:ABC-2 type transport system permease protein